MSAQRGFTLIEMLVAITLAGVVALLVYGAAAAATDTQDRLAENRRALQSERAMRATLHDALRNAQPAGRRGDTAFVVEARRDAAGRPMDRLSFIAAGAFPPLTADADWAVTVEPTPEGLVLTATPIGVVAPARVLRGAPQITGLQVVVQELTAERAWADRWRFPALVPRAIQLTYWTDLGPVHPPVRLALQLGGTP